ncbi:hypothetical protein C8R42DRAFT_644918 [Lentinula raphanica]|nr:hypothetical protein C8R42DRAFT_644918 [Lentinula raphanica]
MNNLPVPNHVAGTPTAHPVSPSFVKLLEGTSTIIPSSSSTATDHRTTHLMFQAFVDFFDGPITVARSSLTPASASESVTSSLSGSLMADLSTPSSTMASPVSITPALPSDGSLMKFRVSLIMCVVTVSTMVLFIWPVLRAKRLREARMVLEHKDARVPQAREELLEETEERADIGLAEVYFISWPAPIVHVLILVNTLVHEPRNGAVSITQGEIKTRTKGLASSAPPSASLTDQIVTFTINSVVGGKNFDTGSSNTWLSHDSMQVIFLNLCKIKDFDSIVDQRLEQAQKVLDFTPMKRKPNSRGTYGAAPISGSFGGGQRRSAMFARYTLLQGFSVGATMAS